LQISNSSCCKAVQTWCYILAKPLQKHVHLVLADLVARAAYLHLHIIWCKLFHGRLFLSALNHISDSNHAPGYTRTKLMHWVYGMMLLTKQIGTYAKAKCPRISNSNGKKAQ
jgi:hypothetical protein